MQRRTVGRYCGADTEFISEYFQTIQAIYNCDLYGIVLQWYTAYGFDIQRFSLFLAQPTNLIPTKKDTILQLYFNTNCTCTGSLLMKDFNSLISITNLLLKESS